MISLSLFRCLAVPLSPTSTSHPEDLRGIDHEKGMDGCLLQVSPEASFFTREKREKTEKKEGEVEGYIGSTIFLGNEPYRRTVSFVRIIDLHKSQTLSPFSNELCNVRVGSVVSSICLWSIEPTARKSLPERCFTASSFLLVLLHRRVAVSFLTPFAAARRYPRGHPLFRSTFLTTEPTLPNDHISQMVVPRIV